MNGQHGEDSGSKQADQPQNAPAASAPSHEETPLLLTTTSRPTNTRPSRPPPSRKLSSRLVHHFSFQDSDDEEEHSKTMLNLFGFDPTLSISILLGLVSGTLYGFGRYSRDLKDTLHLTQTQVQTLGILLDTGNYVGHPLTGYVYDVYGPRISCLAAALVVFGGYAAIHAIVNDNNDGIDEKTESTAISSLQWTLLGLSFTLVGFGSGLGYVSALGSTTKKYTGTERSGRAVGLVAAGYGLCSTLVGITYEVVGLYHFFFLWAVLVAVVNCLGAFLFPPARKRTSGSKTTAKKIVEDKLDADPDTNNNTESEDGQSWTTWRQLSYWVLFYSFACVTGCGLFVINNVSTIVQSIGGQDSFAGALVFLLSISNCAGRIVVGIAADAGQLSKLTLFRIASVIMAVALLISAAAGPNTSNALLVVTVGLVAMSYGANWVIIVGILSDMYGKKNFGKDYGVIALGPALSGMAFNSASAMIYEQHVDMDDGSSAVCIGSSCYRASFVLTAMAAITGLILLSFVGHPNTGARSDR